jgi:spermidine synthase
VGASTLAYEVLWSRVLRYFVDTSLQSFATVLAAFLCGIAAGSALAGRRANPGRDAALWLGAILVGAGVASVLSLEGVARTTQLVAWVEHHASLEKGFVAQAVASFLVFSVTLLAPTALLGAAFPMIVRAADGRSPAPPEPGRNLGTVSLGRIYAFHTAGGVAGSLAAGFLLLPTMGVQKSVYLVSGGNVALGVAFLSLSGLARRPKLGAAAGSAALFVAALATVRSDAVLSVYTERYASPAHELLFLSENVGSTTAVFRQAGTDRRYLVIDGRGEVSNDYFSMRAFRLLALLPVFYAPRATSTLVVTFGSGIVAGTLAGVADVKDEDCVEICSDAFGAAEFFSTENHSVLGNPKVRRHVDDGRHYLSIDRSRYDVISADATHPRSGDSWALYTKEFYELGAAHLTDHGVMSQWIPMHGVSESELRSILRTFHAAFPFVAVYYAGGLPGAGHLVILGSRSPLRVEVPRAERLFAMDAIRQDLADVNVLDLQDLFAGFLFGEAELDSFVAGAPLNTDDLPVLAFGASDGASHSWLSSVAGRRQSIFPYLSGMDPASAAGIEEVLHATFDATGHALRAQVLEAQEYEGRSDVARSRDLLSQATQEYATALQINPRDAHTTYLLRHVTAEAKSLAAVAP